MFASVPAAHSEIPPLSAEHVNIWGSEQRQPRAVSLSRLTVSPKGSSSVPLTTTLLRVAYSSCATPRRKKHSVSSRTGLAGSIGHITSSGNAVRVAVQETERRGPPFPRAVQIWAAIWHSFPSAQLSRLPSHDSQCFLTQPGLLSSPIMNLTDWAPLHLQSHSASQLISLIKLYICRETGQQAASWLAQNQNQQSCSRSHHAKTSLTLQKER